MAKAHSVKLDLVMRNSATDPATVKLMDYKREVFRKLLMRLGKRFAEGREGVRVRGGEEEEVHSVEREYQVTRSAHADQGGA